MKGNFLLNMRCALLYFWSRYPAFQFSVAFLIGIASSFHSSCLIFCILLQKKLLFLLVIGGFFYSLLVCPRLALSSPIAGSCAFHIEQVSRHPSLFKPLLVYEGTLRNFQSDDQILHRLPCRIYIKPKGNRPLAAKDYVVSDVLLSPTKSHYFLLKANKKTQWRPMENTRSSAELRFKAKEKVRTWVQKNFQKKSNQHLINSLLTGQKENRLQNFQFGQLGLQHLLAISGFHFAILTLFLSAILRCLFSLKIMSYILIVLLSIYFFYMGKTPSITRAWVGSIIFLGGIILRRKTSPINALGAALLYALISDPLILFNLSFQLSFAATLGILLFYLPSEKFLGRIFLKRSFLILKQLPILDQWGVYLSTYLRKTLALNLSVCLFTLPILLFHFHKFPLISLVYNLFFPILFSFLFGLLFFSLVFSFFLPLVKIYSSLLLWFITYAPKKLMFSLRFPAFSIEIACCVLIVFFLWGVYLHWSSNVIKEWQLT